MLEKARLWMYVIRVYMLFRKKDDFEGTRHGDE